MKTLILILFSCLAYAQPAKLFTYYTTPGVNWGSAKTSAPLAVGATNITLTGLTGTVPAAAQFTLSGVVYTVTTAVAVSAGSAVLPVIPLVKAAVPVGTFISQWVWKAVILPAPFTLAVDPAGQATINAPDIAFDQGFITLTSGNHVQVNLDTARVVFRDDYSVPPPQPGPCNRGTGALHIDVTGIYACVANAKHDGEIWIRTPVQTNWIPGELASACTSDLNGNTSCPNMPAPITPPIPVVSVYGETPVADGMGGWTLVHAPLVGGLSCGRGDALLIPGTDYTFNGMSITTTQDWVALGLPLCSYAYYQQ